MLAGKFRKPKMVAWMVSNCHTHSQREQYVEELSKSIPVDIYGQCGPLKCRRNEANGDEQCLNLLESQYLFYLSFENSICKDYVTEKFWNALSRNLLPIVLGGSNYTQIAPPKSFINVADFTSPAQLGKYLNYLAGNLTAYSEYFEWKQYFNVYSAEEQYLSRAMCKLCEKLNSPYEEEPEKIYNSIHSWWRNDAQCHVKGTFPWSKPEKVESRMDSIASWTNFLVKNTANVIESLRDSKVIV
jgi:alpha-1,3-fucosyltransferase